MKKQAWKERDAQIKSQQFSTAYYVQDAASATTWTIMNKHFLVIGLGLLSKSHFDLNLSAKLYLS